MMTMTVQDSDDVNHDATALLHILSWLESIGQYPLLKEEGCNDSNFE